MNLYQCAASRPIQGVDPLGTVVWPKPRLIWELKGQGCDTTGSAEASIILETVPVISFFNKVTIEGKISVSFVWTPDKRTSCSVSWRPLKWKMTRARGWLPPYAWLKVEGTSPDAKATAFAKLDFFYHRWYRAGAHYLTELSGKADYKTWHKKCCKCLHTSGTFEASGDVKANLTGSATLTLGAVAIYYGAPALIELGTAALEALQEMVKRPVPLPVR